MLILKIVITLFIFSVFVLYINIIYIICNNVNKNYQLYI